ncbi:replication protein A 70 kDa DNA-binding subunit A-like [Coffea eugenioides]|uniref:replication protein A 70 kDa DNA-binding subunit A-like n=1 Tax=Coffea eugenioides TaxID=49369 RepID=UPI000F6132E2|nr:replication protein A 70 kDa DNA-binding subunit A-like [Coffea eugenioides]
MADLKYRLAPHQYQLSFGNDTNIVNILDDCGTIPRFKFNLVKLRDTEQHMDNDLQLIDVISLVVSVGSHYQTSINDKTKCDILLLDKSLTVVRLTLCDKFATDDGEHLPQTVTKNNVLLAYGICVRNYKGPSLYTIRASKLYVNYYLNFAQYLHSWFENDKCTQKLVTWLRSCNFIMSQALLISNVKRISISKYAVLPTVKYFWILAYIQSINIDNIFHELCKNCGQSCQSHFTKMVYIHCNDVVDIIVRYNVNIEVRDSSSNLYLTLQDKHARLMFRCDAAYLRDLKTKDPTFIKVIVYK